MTTTSRKRVLLYLEKNQSATAVEIARALRITPANARHHLALLIEDGLVQSSGIRQPGGRGRPTKVYRLGSTVSGENVSGLFDIALSALWERWTEDECTRFLEEISERLAGEAILPSGTHITRRLSSAIDRLNALKYHARWEAHAEGPRLIFGNCPYLKVIDAHPELCLMDADMLSRLLSQGVEQTAKLEQGERWVPVCIFILGQL